MTDTRLLKKSFAWIEPQSHKVIEQFFATLFVREPHLRGMFPVAMGAHHERFFGEIARYVWSCDAPEAVVRRLSDLALDHRKFGVGEEHYGPFCDALLASLRSFAGYWWTPAIEAAWSSALGYLRAVMSDAVHGADGEPPWWLAEVVGHDRRRPDLAVLTLRPAGGQWLRYRPGQHVSVQVPCLPRIWREYSIANAWALDGLLRLHVRAIAGGTVSTQLVHHTKPGDSLLLGRARGAMHVGELAARDVLCVAAGTGLAPVKAIVEALASADRPSPRPRMQVLLGARSDDDLYDLTDLRELEQACPALTVIPVVPGDGIHRGLRGRLPDLIAAHLPAGQCDVVVSGPPSMVSTTAEIVARRSPHARIHLDPELAGR